MVAPELGEAQEAKTLAQEESRADATAELEMDDACAVGLFGAADRDAKDVTVEAQGGFDVSDGDADMGDGRLHGHGT